MAAHEQLILDILANTTNAQRGIGSLARAVGAADEDVGGLAKRLDELGKKSAEARVGLKGNAEAQAQLDKLDAKMLVIGRRLMDPKITVEGAARAAFELQALSAEFDKLGRKAEEAAGGTGGAGGLAALTGGGGGPGGIAALITAGVALSPVLLTVGTGLAGLAAAAYGVAKPIENAAKKTGGLQANLKTLDPLERQVAVGILGLGKQYDAFQQALKPEVIGIFNQGLRLAGHLMHDVEPVARATGRALGGLLASVDREFQSGTWQQFFGFMARTAGPDIKLLGQDFTDLLDVLPRLIEKLQPVARGILHVSDSVFGMIRNLERGNTGLEQFLKYTARVGTTGVPQVVHSSGVLGGALHLVENAGKAGSTALRDWAFGSTKAASSADQAARSTTAFGAAGQAAARAAETYTTALGRGAPVIAGTAAGQHYLAEQSVNAANAQKLAAAASFQLMLRAKGAAGASRDLAGNAVAAASAGVRQAAAAHESARQLFTMHLRALAAAGSAGDVADRMRAQAAAEKASYQQLQQLIAVTDKYITNTSSMLGATNSVITDIRQMTKDSKAAGASFTGLNANSITLQNDLSQNLIPTVSTVIKRMQGAGANSHDLAKVLSSDLKPAVDRGALANKDLRDEIFAMARVAGYTGPNKIKPLTGFIDRNAGSLRGARNDANSYTRALKGIPGDISTHIKVTAQAQIAVSTGVQRQIPGRRAARGMLITAGTTPTADDVLIRASKGETVVPAYLTPAVAPLMKAHGVPGFASGGFVGSYAGSLPGLTKWIHSEDRAIARVIAKAVEQGVRSALAASSFGATGPGGGAPAANAALARRMFPGENFAAWNYVAMRECLTLDTEILTRRGWLPHDEVQVGDETIGYNPETGQSEWTRIERVVHYESQPIVRFGNKYWSARCTPEHRWLAEQIRNKTRYGPRPERRQIEHREYVAGESLVTTEGRKRGDRVVLARPADLGSELPITVNEAALLGWIAGDGTVHDSCDYWYDRKPELAATVEAPYGYRRDGQPKKNRSGAPRKTGQYRKTHPLSISICQAKPDHFAAIDQACSDAPAVGRSVQVTRPGWRDVHVWRLSAAYSRGLLERAGHPKRDAVAQVLAMSPEQRAAWLDAMIRAEGHRGETKTTIYQDDGPVADATELAIYLSGKRPSRTKDARGEGKSWAIRVVTPNVGGPSRNSFTEGAGVADVWCVTTTLGTWTARQDGHVFLTGNSGWNQFARNPSSGAYGIPQALPESKLPFAGQAAGGSNPAAQISWMEGYMRSRYGGAAGAAAHERAFNWYDDGGWLPPGPSLAVNNTGQPERVLKPGQPPSVALTQNGDVYIRDPVDIPKIGQRLSFAIVSSGFG